MEATAVATFDFLINVEGFVFIGIFINFGLKLYLVRIYGTSVGMWSRRACVVQFVF